MAATTAVLTTTTSSVTFATTTVPTFITTTTRIITSTPPDVPVPVAGPLSVPIVVAVALASAAAVAIIIGIIICIVRRQHEAPKQPDNVEVLPPGWRPGDPGPVSVVGNGQMPQRAMRVQAMDSGRPDRITSGTLVPVMDTMIPTPRIETTVTPAAISMVTPRVEPAMTVPTYPQSMPGDRILLNAASSAEPATLVSTNDPGRVQLLTGGSAAAAVDPNLGVSSTYIHHIEPGPSYSMVPRSDTPYATAAQLGPARPSAVSDSQGYTVFSVNQPAAAAPRASEPRPYVVPAPSNVYPTLPASSGGLYPSLPPAGDTTPLGAGNVTDSRGFTTYRASAGY